MLVASGVSYRQLDTPGFAELTGAGIYYGAAMTEARACAEQQVVVIGGANSAGQAAVYFSGYAAQVTMLVRGASLEKSMSHYLIEQIAALAEHRGAHGQRGGRGRGRGRPSAAAAVRGPRRRADAGRRRVLRVHRRRAAHRLARGRRRPRRARLHPRRARRAGRRLAAAARAVRCWRRACPGVFVAGDVRARSIKRVASAVGEGSMAVSLIHEYLLDA